MQVMENPINPFPFFNAPSSRRRVGSNANKYNHFRMIVLERDDYTCVKCGERHEKGMVVHHIFPYSEYPELRLDPTYATTFCMECEHEFHRKFGVQGIGWKELAMFLGGN